MRSTSISRAEGLAQRAPLALVVAIVALPLVTLVVKSATSASAGLLYHLVRTVLPSQAALGACAAIGAVILGVALSAGGLGAALFDFPGRALLDRALIAPLLLPTWFLAVIHREIFGARGVLWLALVLGVGASPLFHLLGSAALRDLPGGYVDVLRLGGRRGAGLARHLVPLSFPALGAAALLVALLAWSDATTARALAVSTAAVGVLDQWAAGEDASVGALLGLVVAAVSCLAGGLLLAALTRVPLHDDGRLGAMKPRRVRLEGAWGLVPWLLAAPQLALGVLIPAAAIGVWSAARIERADFATLGTDAARTLLLATAATLLAVTLALPLLHAQTFARRASWGRATSFLALVPFALPSTVLAAAALWMAPSGGPATYLHDSLVPLVVALGVRFAAPFVGAGHAALERHGRDHVTVMRLLGRDDISSLVSLLRPFLARPVAAAASFVFLEVLKDVPLTVVLSPFGFRSISAHVFQLAQTERTRDCAVWMLCLALVGIFPLMTLARSQDADEEPAASPC
jgi:iron(III) transport system permease protein